MDTKRKEYEEIIKNLILEKEGEKVTVKMLVDKMDYKRSRLYVVFLALFGCTPGKMMKKIQNTFFLDKIESGNSPEIAAADLGMASKTMRKRIKQENIENTGKNEGRFDSTKVLKKDDRPQNILVLAVGLLLLSVIVPSVEAKVWVPIFVLLFYCIGGAYYVVFGCIFSFLQGKVTERRLKMYKGIEKYSAGLVFLTALYTACLSQVIG